MESAADIPSNTATDEQPDRQLRHFNRLARQAVDCGARIAKLNTRFAREMTQNLLSAIPGALHHNGTPAVPTAPLSGLDAYIADVASISIDMQTALRTWMEALLADHIRHALPWLPPYPAGACSPLQWDSSSAERAPPLWSDQITQPARTAARATPSDQRSATGSIHDRRN